MTLGKALNPEILYAFFNAVNMHRWNDHMRPVDLTELDKQAHKAMICWFLGRYEETETGCRMDWNTIIEHSMFSFIQRLVLTDLKPQLFHRVISEKFEEVNRYVMEEFDRIVPDTNPEFREHLKAYLWSDKSAKEDAVIRAAHYLATRWEFNVIYDSNRSMYGIEETRKEIEDQILQHEDLVGVCMLMKDRGSKNFVDILGQLRFQQRWARTPRIPKTTVLGHSLMVASSVFLADFDRKAGPEQIYNDYYSGLFHDLPEVLTKDVISPVKINVGGLSTLLEGYEHELMESRIMPLIPGAWHEELKFFTYDPFKDFDSPPFGKRCGHDIKACDLLSAYLEAWVSRQYGITSATLMDGESELKSKMKKFGVDIDTDSLVEGIDRLSI